MEDLFYQIALRQTPRIGDISAKHLYSYFGSAQKVFEASELDLLACGHFRKDMLLPLQEKVSWQEAEKAMRFIEKEQIQALLFNHSAYPQRLKNLEDAPFLLFYKGNLQALNPVHALAIIGTRTPTAYGLQTCETLLEDLLYYQPSIFSGLAYGIDICAHKKSLALGLPTIGILGHGLDIIYPSLHTKIAEQMINSNGGLLTSFLNGNKPNREHFPVRNHIVAGISDAVIVIETAQKGGSMFTAQVANQYKKDVFAVPGRLDDNFSKGCNALIQKNQATLLQNAHEIATILGWENKGTALQHQTQLFIQLSQEEEIIVNCLLGQPAIHLDTLIYKTGFSTSKIAALLLELEMKNYIKALPGKHFKLR